MRRFLWGLVVAAAFLVVVGVVVAVAWSVGGGDATRGLTITVDGEPIDGAAVAAMFGVGAAIAVAVVCIATAALVASLAIAVPVALAGLGFALTFALVVALAPILVPVLLVVGAYALLTRGRRRRVPTAATAPAAPTVP